MRAGRWLWACYAMVVPMVMFNPEGDWQAARWVTVLLAAWAVQASIVCERRRVRRGL